MAKAPPIDPVADIAAMIAERKIEDRVIYGHTHLSDIASGAVPIPVTDRVRLKTLAFVLRCQPFYLYKIVKDWNAHQAGEPIEERAPPVKQHDWIALAEKASAADAAKQAAAAAKKAADAAKAAALPKKQCTHCKEEKPITEFYEHGGRCKVCHRARARAYQASHRKPKRKLPGVTLCGTYWAPPSEV
jgi:hypothetical protein